MPRSIVAAYGGGGRGGNANISTTDGIIISSVLGGCTLIIFLVICGYKIYKIYNKYYNKNVMNMRMQINRHINERNTENDTNREKLGLKPLFDYTQNNSVDNKVLIPKETIV